MGKSRNRYNKALKSAKSGNNSTDQARESTTSTEGKKNNAVRQQNISNSSKNNNGGHRPGRKPFDELTWEERKERADNEERDDNKRKVIDRWGRCRSPHNTNSFLFTDVSPTVIGQVDTRQHEGHLETMLNEDIDELLARCQSSPHSSEKVSSKASPVPPGGASPSCGGRISPPDHPAYHLSTASRLSHPAAVSAAAAGVSSPLVVPTRGGAHHFVPTPGGGSHPSCSSLDNGLNYNSTAPLLTEGVHRDPPGSRQPFSPFTPLKSPSQLGTPASPSTPGEKPNGTCVAPSPQCPVFSDSPIGPAVGKATKDPAAPVPVVQHGSPPLNFISSQKPGQIVSPPILDPAYKLGSNASPSVKAHIAATAAFEEVETGEMENCRSLECTADALDWDITSLESEIEARTKRIRAEQMEVDRLNALLAARRELRKRPRDEGT